ncbi:uncharacterized protein LOC144881906 isoform X1 [Branchiostoma floridae x Branchiostoma japonicum]
MPVPESTLANNFDGQSTLYVVTEDADLDVDTTGPAITTMSIPRPRETEASAESITASTPQATEAAVESTTTSTPQATEAAVESTTASTPQATEASAESTTTSTPQATEAAVEPTTTSTPQATEASAESTTTSTPQATEAAVESTTTPAPQSTEPAAESTKIPETTSPKAFSCDGKDPDLYPDPEDCTKYYECVGGFADPFHRSCAPGGPVFDPKKKYCDWPENVALPCGQVSADVPNAVEEDAVATFTCEGKAPGIHPDPENCDKFYQCVPGHPGPYQRDCPPGGLVFDAELQVCNWPWAVQAPCGTLPTEFRNRQ